MKKAMVVLVTWCGAAFLWSCGGGGSMVAAMVISVEDGWGDPVDGASFLVDGSQTVVTGSQLNEGQVYLEYDGGGSHTIQLDVDSLTDPQGGIAWVPLASRISGDPVVLSYASRPFAGADGVLHVPVSSGEVTVATIYLADVLVSPADNQWLTDGLDSANAYRTADTDEFAASPRPVFWWRQDPSLGDTVNFTVQVWEDEDGDTRYPLGVIDQDDYAAFARTPLWEEGSQALFSTVLYSSGGTAWPLGWTCAYAGSPLSTALPGGEYAWRVIQENPDRQVTRVSKLGAFYTYPGYYYATTEGGGIGMSSPSAVVGHREIFGLAERTLSSADVLGSPFDSGDPAGFRQRTVTEFSDDLSAGSDTTNQLALLYDIDQNGKAVIYPDTVGGDYAGIVRIRIVNKQPPSQTPGPWLQGKELWVACNTGDEDLFIAGWPMWLSGLDNPDWTEPKW